ncbi:hypothetical protein [Alginatibacterium sediminis]|nr:hypothetical protein [Alginatibacterium sediminis]
MVTKAALQLTLERNVLTNRRATYNYTQLLEKQKAKDRLPVNLQFDRNC